MGHLWKAARYAIIVYFSILILPFVLSRYIYQFVVSLRPSGLNEPWDLPDLDSGHSGHSTPRSSGEWEPHTWESRVYSSQKYHRNLHEKQHPLRLWEDDDGYGVVGKRGFGVIYEED